MVEISKVNKYSSVSNTVNGLLYSLRCQIQRKRSTYLVVTVHSSAIILNLCCILFQSKVDVTSWLEPINLCQQMKEAALKLFKDEETSDLDEIFMYQVL